MRGHRTPGVHVMHYSSTEKYGEGNPAGRGLTPIFPGLMLFTFVTQTRLKRHLAVIEMYPMVERIKWIIHIVNIASRVRIERV